MHDDSRRLAGILLAVYPTVVFGGVSLLSMLVFDPSYKANPLRQDLWRAGHAHAGIMLLLSLVALRYVDEAVLSHGQRAFVRNAIPTVAILLPLAFFLSVLDPRAERPNAIIYLAYVAALILISAMVVLGMGLMRRSPRG